MTRDPAPSPDAPEVNSRTDVDARDRFFAQTPVTKQAPVDDIWAFPAEAAAPSGVTLPDSKPVFKVVSSKAPAFDPAWPSTASEPEPYTTNDSTPKPTSLPRRWNVAQLATLVFATIAVVEFFLLVSQARRPSAAVAPPALSTITVESTPPGAEILINGQRRGTTPATVTLNDGEYSMSLVRGTFARSVPLIVRGGTSQHMYFADTGVAAPLESGPAPTVTTAAPSPVPPPSNAVGGWLSVDAPIDVQLFEGAALIGSNRSDRIMLPVGRHVIDAVSTALGYKTSTAVQVSAGSVARLRLQMPPGTLNINALPWADVAVDGRKLGTTPLGNVSLPIGAHEIVFNHPQLGERRQTVMVTLNAVNRVSVDFNQR